MIALVHHIITDIFESVMAAYNSPQYSMIVRIYSKYTNKFEIPRWHVDGCGCRTKIGKMETSFLTVLKGEGTLIYDCTESEARLFCDEYMKLSRLPDGLEKRQKVIEKCQFLTNKEKVSSLQLGEGFILRPNSYIDIATVHSEPLDMSDRIYLAITPIYSR